MPGVSSCFALRRRISSFLVTLNPAVTLFRAPVSPASCLPPLPRVQILCGSGYRLFCVPAINRLPRRCLTWYGPLWYCVFRPEQVQAVFAVNPATSFGRTAWRSLGPLLSLAPKSQYKAASVAVFAATIPDFSQVRPSKAKPVQGQGPPLSEQ